jgi:hypothetical protein
MVATINVGRSKRSDFPSRLFFRLKIRLLRLGELFLDRFGKSRSHRAVASATVHDHIKDTLGSEFQ